MSVVMGQKMWYEALGFRDNPFSLEPINASTSLSNSFVDRLEEREQLRKFVQEKSGAIVVLSQIGEGKSSLLNMAEVMANHLGKLVIRVNPRNIPTKLNKFLEVFILSFMNADISKLSNDRMELISETRKQVRDYAINSFTEIALEIFNTLFEKVPSVLIMDDLDKRTDLKDYENFLRKIVDALPKNFLIITTGNINQVIQSNELVNLMYEIFNVPIILGIINNTEKLKEFIVGRMNAYALVKGSFLFPDEIYVALLDKTRGNLRETFRYLSELLKIGQAYDVEQLITVIKNVDGLKIGQLDDTGKALLNTLAGKKLGLDEIKPLIGGSVSTLRNRLDDLEQLGLVFKSKIVGQGKKIGYSSPQIIKQVIDEIIPHSALSAQDLEILH